MKILILLSILTASYIAHSYGLEPNDRNDYIYFRNLLDKDVLNPPTLKIYDNFKFSGKPILELDKTGLRIRDKLVCEWPKEYAEKPDYRVLRELNSENPCRHSPVYTDSDPGGPTMLWVELSDSSVNEYYETLFEGQKAYIDKKSSTDFTFALSKKKQFDLKRPEDQAVYEKFLLEDSSFKDYVAKLYDCAIKETESCFVNGKRDFAKNYERFTKQICDNNGYNRIKMYKKLGKYCANLRDSESLSQPYSQKAKEKDREARQAIKKEYWSNYRSCFFDENPTRLLGEISKSTNIKIKKVVLYPKDDVYFQCTILGNLQKNGKITWQVKI